MATTQTRAELRLGFFDFLFEAQEGWLCLATSIGNNKDTFKQRFLRWPEERTKIGSLLEAVESDHNVWFGINLLSRPERKKEFCLPTDLVWADLDTATPGEIDPVPQVVTQTSPMRFQGIWRLTEPVNSFEASAYSRKIAYAYADKGIDLTGWDLTQLLRVPFTYNHKYGPIPPEVQVVTITADKIETVVFESLPEPPPAIEDADVPGVPDLKNLPQPEMIGYKYRELLQSVDGFNQLYGTIPSPDEDWSRKLWRLIHICLDVGMTPEETFVLAYHAKCNKYARDKRPTSHLWHEVVRAAQEAKRLAIIVSPTSDISFPELLTVGEYDDLPDDTWVDRYRLWASQATDAVETFHDLAGFITLSAVLSQGITLKVEYGDMRPNLWGLILGDSTLTRKTTAMRMATDLIAEIDKDILLATDGSVEGLLTGLSLRPNRASIYFRDEVSGFFSTIKKKDYLSGMPETLTQLYDAPAFYSRRLRKEVITISSPLFIFFGGGIKEKVYGYLDDEDIISGFLPRFLVVTGTTDTTRLRPTSPRTETGAVGREQLKSELAAMHQNYIMVQSVQILGQETTLERVREVELTPEAWARYQDIERRIADAAQQTTRRITTLPTFERLSRSLLKMSVLLAASRIEPDIGDDVLQAEEIDVMQAAKFIQRWAPHTIDLILNVGLSFSQRQLDRILEYIRDNPGVMRGQVMQMFRLMKRDTDDILNTLADRGLIKQVKVGRGTSLIPM